MEIKHILLIVAIFFHSVSWSQSCKITEITKDGVRFVVVLDTINNFADTVNIDHNDFYFIKRNELVIVDQGYHIHGGIRYEIKIKERQLFNTNSKVKKSTLIIIHGKCGSFEYSNSDAGVFWPSSINFEKNNEFLEFSFGYDLMKSSLFILMNEFDTGKFEKLIKIEFKKNRLLKKCSNIEIIKT